MATIYEITNDIEFILTLMEEGEVDQEALNGALDVSLDELKLKMEHYCQFIRNLDSDIEGLKAEEKRLADKRKALENTKDRMKKAMEWAIGKVYEGSEEPKKIVCGTFTCALQKNPPSTIIDCEESLIPEKYLIPQPPKVDKKLLKADIDSGVDLSGIAHLETSESIRIK